MPLFVFFVFGAIVLGAGAMLSPAWPTVQPRIGLASAFSVAIIIGGAVFLASLFGWDTLLIDYLLFALVVGIFLGGTLSFAQARAEKRGETLSDMEQGWPGPQDLGFFAVVALVFFLPALVMPVPLGENGQFYGYLALITRNGESFQTFAPFHPEIEYLYPPGFSALTAYLSQQLNQGIHITQYTVAAVLCLVNVLLAYDLGSEIQDKRLGRAFSLVMLLSLGLFGAFLSANYTAILGLTFAQAFVIFVIRYPRTHLPGDAFVAGLMLGACAISHPGTTIYVLLGYVFWLGLIWLAQPRPDLQTWLVMAFAIPLVALVAISPWLADIMPLLNGDLISPFERVPENMIVMLTYHGLWVIPLVVIGGWMGFQNRDPVVLFMLGWLFMVVDFSITGGIAALLPQLDQYAHPLDIAWHGPIIPYTVLGGLGLMWVWDNMIAPRTGSMSYLQTYITNSGVIIVIALVAFFSRQIFEATATFHTLPDAYASADDVAALRWIRENTEPDVRLLNFPSYLAPEGDWVPVIAERDSVYFPLFPYAELPSTDMMFSPVPMDEEETNPLILQWSRFADFWRDPVNTDRALFDEYNVRYIVVPQMYANPESANNSWRWRDAVINQFQPQSNIADVPYLERAFERNGAAVYEVVR